MHRKIVQGVTTAFSVMLIRDQVKYVASHGFNIKVVCNNSGNQSYDGIPIKLIPFEREISPYKDAVSLYKLYRYLKVEKPEIINFGTPKAGLIGMIAGYLARVEQRIYIIRGLRLETVGGLKRTVLVLSEKVACKLSTHVMVISDSLEETLVGQRIVDPDKVVRIGRGSSNGIDLEKFNPAHLDQDKRNDLRIELDLKDEDIVIGYVGRITKDKGINELVLAFCRLAREHKNVKLLLIGEHEDGDPIAREHRETIVNHERIIHCAYTARPEYYYSLMDIFAFPTFREGFGNVSIEAQAMGVPVVTFNVTGARDTVLDGKTGLIADSTDETGLFESVDRLISHPLLRMRMAANARNFVVENFDRKVMQEALLDFYQLLGGESDDDGRLAQNLGA